MRGRGERGEREARGAVSLLSMGLFAYRSGPSNHYML